MSRSARRPIGRAISAPIGDEEGDAGDEAAVDDELQEDMLEASDESGIGDDDVLPDVPEGEAEADDKIE